MPGPIITLLKWYLHLYLYIIFQRFHSFRSTQHSVPNANITTSWTSSEQKPLNVLIKAVQQTSLSCQTAPGCTIPPLSSRIFISARPHTASAQHQQQVGQQCCTALCSAPAAEMQPLCRQRTAPQRVELGQHRSAHPAPTTRSAGLSVKMQENAYVGCVELSFLCQKMCSWCIHICKCIKCFTSLPNRASRCSSIPTKNSRSRACSIPSSSRNHTPLPGLHRYR